MDKEIIKVFLETIFNDHLARYGGFIETRQIKGRGAKCSFYKDVSSLLDDLDTYAGNVFYGIAPRTERQGRKDAVKYITCLWVDADVKTADKPKAFYDTKKQAIEALNAFHLKPSIIVDSGNGLHCYWLLRESVEVDLAKVESILDGLKIRLHCDNCGDIGRVFRLPGTVNLKDPAQPKETRLVFFNPNVKYSIDDFREEEEEGGKQYSDLGLSGEAFEGTLPQVDFNTLKRSRILPTILSAIKEGDVLDRYPSRSERDQAVILELLLNRFTREQIKAIFNNPDFAVSDRYLSLGRRGDAYLLRSILKAEKEIENKKISLETPRDLKANLPRTAFRVLSKYLPLGEKLLPIDRSYEKIEDETRLIYRKTNRTRSGEEVREYIIRKDVVGPDTTINLDYLREAYIASVVLLSKQREEIIEFNLQDKINGIIYQDDRPISGTERKDRALAEALLYYTDYRRYTKERGREIESLQHLYSGLEVTRDASGHVWYKVALNKMYLKDMIGDTGIIEAKGKEGYVQLSLPLREPGTERDRRIRHSLQELKRFLRYKPENGQYLRYRVDTHLRAIGVKDYELARKGLCREIWAYIEPTFKQAGHKIEKVTIPAGRDREDVRGWVLTLRRGAIWGEGSPPKIFTTIPKTQATIPKTQATIPKT